MKQTILAFSLILLSSAAYGQTEQPDTFAVTDLGEITVTADFRRADAVKTVYVPDSRQRATATDGLSLLARMNVAQLSVNPVTETIQTADNQGVSLFINCHPASSEDVAGLNPADVKRVEYLDFPVDPRFLRAQHVVNFITYLYSYGGYTKLIGKERFMVNSGEAAVYSKMAYKDMEYDLIVIGNYDYNPHTGRESNEYYRLANMVISRESLTETGRRHEREMFAAFRAGWHKGSRLSFRNLITYRRNRVPVNDTEGGVYFSGLYPAERYTSSAPFSNSALGWESELYGGIGKGWAFNGNLEAEIRNNHTVDTYMTSASEIINRADEEAWFLTGNIQVNKSLNEKLSVFGNVLTGGGKTVIDYSGSSNAVNKFRQSFAGVYFGVAINYGRVAGSIDGGYAFESNEINGDRSDDRYPFTHINLQFAPNHRNSLSVWFQYASMSPDAAMKNPNVIRQSELMYIGGNPSLQCSRHVSANLSYTWLPNNRWQMSAYAVFFRIINRQIAVYSPSGPDGLMLKKYENDGDYNHGQIGMRVTGNFIDGKLSVGVAPRFLLYKTTGTNSLTHYPFMGSLNADYYLGNFYFNLYLESRSSYVDGETGYLRKMPSAYSVGLGWTSKGWNIQMSFVNPFRGSWKMSEDTFGSEWFDSHLIQFGSDYHRRISLNVTYTFNYGKKVNASTEIAGEGDVTSSILR